MAIRSRIKQKIKTIIGFNSDRPIQRQDSTPASKSREPEEKIISAEPPKQLDSQAEKPPSESQKKPTSEEKIQRHLLRTQKGLLKFLQKEGGTTELSALHTHSETRFLIGHQKFSELMENMVDTELIHYDWDSQEATITEKGIAFIAN